MHCSVIEHGMTSLSFKTAVQKTEAKVTLFKKSAKHNRPKSPKTQFKIEFQGLKIN